MHSFIIRCIRNTLSLPYCVTSTQNVNDKELKTKTQKKNKTVYCLLGTLCVCVYVFSDLSFNDISAISKRWLYGLDSLQRLYVVTLLTYLLSQPTFFSVVFACIVHACHD